MTITYKQFQSDNYTMILTRKGMTVELAASIDPQQINVWFIDTDSRDISKYPYISIPNRTLQAHCD